MRNEGFQLVKDVSYGDGPRRQLDIYLPEPARTDAPIIVFFYGGEWESGSKETHLFVGQALAARGFVVVIPDYRLYPEVRYPAFLEDSAQAVQWTATHAAKWGGDRDRLFLMGHSAGAYNAAMLAFDRHWLDAAGFDRRHDLRGFIGLAGPYDFLPLQSATLKTIFGPEDQLPATQPIHYVTRQAPPTLLLTGTDDDVVDPGNSRRLAAAIEAAGGHVEEKQYPGIGHIELIGAIAWPARFLAPVLHDIVAFAAKEGGGPQP